MEVGRKEAGGGRVTSLPTSSAATVVGSEWEGGPGSYSSYPMWPGG